MNKIWMINIDILEQFYKMVDKLETDMNKELNRYEREIVFLEMMKLKDIKPAGQNELTKDEFIKELVSKGKKILNIDKNGFTFIKKKEK